MIARDGMRTILAPEPCDPAGCFYPEFSPTKTGLAQGYWTYTAGNYPETAWLAFFQDAFAEDVFVSGEPKLTSCLVRAVRGRLHD